MIGYPMQIYIDVANSTACAGHQNGAVLASYYLETKRSWNFGYRKHMRELTGRIVVKFPGPDMGYRVCDDWDAVRQAIRDVYMVNPETVPGSADPLKAGV